MTLVHNERTKLAANALGKTFNYSPGAEMWIGLFGVATWILGPYILHLIARRILGGLLS
jgi:type IV secretory pathway TrbD component